ncbi:MAG: hypothetical protein RMJ31_03260 [Nitrososphaerota archaeon]|nr:hypothetical protein [Nitrososphaerales archaeon]MDW8044775.1 hypothetical protein [Nitrososphaerota archaeon]
MAVGRSYKYLFLSSISLVDDAGYKLQDQVLKRGSTYPYLDIEVWFSMY